MPKGYETLIHWLHFFLIVAAVCATVFPIAYSVVPWYRTALGRVLMLHAVALALALDVTIIYTYWTKSNIALALWINFFVFGAIAFANVAFTYILIKSQVRKQSLTEQRHHGIIQVVESKEGKKVYSLEFDGNVDDLDKQREVVFKVQNH